VPAQERRITNAGVYDFQADGVSINIDSGTTSTFTNTSTGTIRKSAGASTDRSYLRVSNFANNGGSFDVQTGRLALGSTSVSSTPASSYNVLPNAVLDLTDNTYTPYSGTFANGSGGGNARLRNGTLAVGDTPVTFDLPAGMLEWGEQGGTIDGSAFRSQAGLPSPRAMVYD
jgi:hypothetical protein